MAMFFCQSVRSFVCRQRVVIGHWPDWRSSALVLAVLSGCRAAGSVRLWQRGLIASALRRKVFSLEKRWNWYRKIANFCATLKSRTKMSVPAVYSTVKDESKRAYMSASIRDEIHGNGCEYSNCTMSCWPGIKLSPFLCWLFFVVWRWARGSVETEVGQDQTVEFRVAP